MLRLVGSDVHLFGNGLLAEFEAVRYHSVLSAHFFLCYFIFSLFSIADSIAIDGGTILTCRSFGYRNRIL
jgi:hypothetical protein